MFCLACPDFFDIFIGKIEKKVKSNTIWEVIEDASSFLGVIGVAIKCGFDASNMGTLVADMSRLSKEILEGLKNGTYHIGLAKDGGYRPAILDKSEQHERRCVKCHKRLIDETVPYCYRCRLEMAGPVAAGAATVAKIALGGRSTDDDES